MCRIRTRGGSEGGKEGGRGDKLRERIKNRALLRNCEDAERFIQ